MYLFGLGPGLFYSILPPYLHQSYCKLVSAVRLIYQKSITREQGTAAFIHFLQYALEFELHYVQRREDHMHFICPIIHTLLHCTPEIFRTGAGYMLFTMDHGT